ncbi:hypothetical protein D3C86_1254150 [compost metagenome]
MDTAVQLVKVILVFIFVMTIVLNFVEKDRIPLMGDFFEKVLPRLPISKIFSRKKK